MKRILFAALFALPLSAQAQQVNVVTACGSVAPNGPLRAGSQSYATVDPNGQLCLSPAGVTELLDRLAKAEQQLEKLEELRK